MDVRVSGKPQLQDLQNGIYTAPLLLALRERKEIRQDLKAYIENPQTEALDKLAIKIKATGAIEKTESLISSYLIKCNNFANRMQISEKESFDRIIENVFKKYF